MVVPRGRGLVSKSVSWPFLFFMSSDYCSTGVYKGPKGQNPMIFFAKILGNSKNPVTAAPQGFKEPTNTFKSATKITKKSSKNRMTAGIFSKSRRGQVGLGLTDWL